MGARLTGKLSQPLATGDVGRLDPAIEGQLSQRPGDNGVGRVALPGDAAIAKLASRQKGNVKRSQLLAMGFTPSAIDHRVACGRLHPRFRGVYLVGHVAEPPYSREFGAVLACGDGAVLSRRSAAELLALIERYGEPTEIHISIPSRSNRRHPGIRVHRTPSLARSDTGTCHDVPCTSPARTLIDFAEDAQLREIERAYHEALAQRLVNPADLKKLVRRLRGHRGAPLIATLLATDGGSTLTRSEAEEIFLALIRSARLPQPAVNARLHGYEVDFLWLDKQLVVEIDGGRWHGNPAAIDRDHRKNAHLRSKDFKVLRYSYGQITHDRDAVLAELAGELAKR